MIDVVEQVIERHPKVKNEGIPERDSLSHEAKRLDRSVIKFSDPLSESLFD